MHKITLDNNGITEEFVGPTKADAEKLFFARVHELNAPKREFRRTATEKPAKGVNGVLLYSTLLKKHFFRIYHRDEEGKILSMTDYELSAEEIWITINDSDVSLFEGVESGEPTNKICFSRKYLGDDNGPV